MSRKPFEPLEGFYSTSADHENDYEVVGRDEANAAIAQDKAAYEELSRRYEYATAQQKSLISIAQRAQQAEAERDALKAECEKLHEENERLCAAIETQDSTIKLAEAVAVIEKVAAHAGHPDAREGGRLVCKTAREFLAGVKKGEK